MARYLGAAKNVNVFLEKCCVWLCEFFPRVESKNAGLRENELRVRQETLPTAQRCAMAYSRVVLLVPREAENKNASR